MKRLICFLVALVLPACACARTITIPPNTTVIEAEAFQGDESIAEAVIPAGVLSIGADAFDGCDPALLIRTSAGSAAMTYAQSNRIDYQADTTYRALLVGQCEYVSPMTALKGPANDVVAMENALSLHPVTPYQCTIRENLTVTELSSAILTTFAEAKEQDVSLLYYSGHGANGGYLVGIDRRPLSPANLRIILDQIPGRKIVIVDACNSGAIIGKSADAVQQSFTEAFITAFSAVKRSLASDSYYVITAARGTQDSMEFQLTTGMPFGLFTWAFCEAIGYDYFNQKEISPKSDENGDGVVTIDEAHQYAARKAIEYYPDQEAQVYPENCTYQSIVRK